MIRKSLFLLLLLSTGWQYTWSQKKPLTHDVYDQWQSIGATAISHSGKISVWEVNPQEGDGMLYVRDNAMGKVITLSRGYRALITTDENHVVAMIKPTYVETRKAKIKKAKADAMPKDSAAIIDLRDGRINKFAKVKGVQMGRDNQMVVAMALETKTLPTGQLTETNKKRSKKDKAKKATPKVNKDAANDMLLYNLASGDTTRLHCVANYSVNSTGNQLAYVYRDKKNSNVVKLRNLSNGEEQNISAEATYITALQFNWTGDRLLFLATADTLASGSKHCSLYEYRLGGGLRTIVTSADSEKLKAGWGITEKSNPYYSRSGNRIFVGIQPYIAPDDKNKYDFETAEPSIWRYDADHIPPMFKSGDLKNGTLRVLCTIGNDGQLVQLATSYYDVVRIANRNDGDVALSSDETGHILEQQWEGIVSKKLSLVNVNTGERTLLTEGKISGESISPDGKYGVWFDLEKQQWMVVNTSTRNIKCLSERLKVNMHNEDNDVPNYATPYAGAEWTADSKGVVLADRYDLWYMPMNGDAPTCLTKGQGRKDSIQYRYQNTQLAGDALGIRADRPIYLKVYNYRTKEYGFAQTNLAGDLKMMAYGKYTYTCTNKADSAEVFMYKKGNFEEPNDLYLLTNTSTQLSHINPQQSEYIWGKPELFQWKAFDGTQLDGILYKPENFDPTKKYPVMIYFYERNSETLYSYRSPSPSRSIINIPYFVSNGYLVFVPDIVYKEGHPGKSAYNCIVSGAKALAANKWVDSKHMAIQGQSWGGYQVAYLIAHTDMFAAAGAGAPVCNMTSAYGGIRWGTGMSRQFQYEHTQSRIGKDLWNGFDLYIENSPIFDYPKVTTPVLIMHNNADGAVPYYQGIEMFMALRRLGKPAWLLEYNREAHNLSNRKNAKDLSVRLSDFFDYYLKGAPKPEWMKPTTPYIINGGEKRLQ